MTIELLIMAVILFAPIAVLTVTLGEAFERIRNLEEAVKDFTKE